MASGDYMERQSDEELVRLCNSGNADEAAAAFDALYRRHRDFVLRVARRFVRDNDSALDVLQETFSYLLDKFPPSGAGLTLTAKLTTLLYPVAKNNAITMRRKARSDGDDTAVDPDELPSPDDQDQDSHRDVSGLLAGLPADRRELLTLRFVDDLSLADIAAALDIPLGTVKSRLHAAIGELRKLPQVKEFFEK